MVRRVDLEQTHGTRFVLHEPWLMAAKEKLLATSSSGSNRMSIRSQSKKQADLVGCVTFSPSRFTFCSHCYFQYGYEICHFQKTTRPS